MFDFDTNKKINNQRNNKPVTTPRFAASDWMTRAAHEANNIIQSSCKINKKYTDMR